MTSERITSPEQLAAVRERIVAERDPARPRITVCAGTGCRANGSMELAAALTDELARHGAGTPVELKLSGCHGFCQQGPVVVVEPEGFFYRHVGVDDAEADARQIVQKTVLAGEPVERLLYRHPETGEPIAHHEDIPFYARQRRIALRNNGKIDPTDIADYIAADGYAALAKALAMRPEDVIGEITASGLRGRGGGGFPTGRKWGFCRNAEDRSVRHIICNADEGDPGAFMDRSIMEGDPHSVLEGMIIGAWATAGGICPAEGYIYIRAEYPLAVQTVREAIRQAEEVGLLGDDILGSGFGFRVRVREGAGAFVCGEETALLASIEGRRGTPRLRPPFPAESGLHGRPSNINNVETWANVAPIIARGAKWYGGIGTESSKGTKVFSLVGKVRNSGLVEVPMGVPLSEIVFEIGGGIPDGKRIKAVQTGGPSGGCIPAAELNTPVDYESLARLGSIMGSGGMVVLDEDTCMVDLARYFVEFTHNECCGKCAPCRLGTRQMLDILNAICSGRARPEDLDLLEELAKSVQKASLCGLGQTAPNPVLTTLQYFRDEYEDHVLRRRCPTTVCRGIASAPCKHTCPAGIDVPRYVRFIAAGRYEDALNVIREKIPFPSVCGYVCFHPCQTHCRRAMLDGGIGVRALKRFVAERASASRPELPRPAPTGRRVAVVGSGPGGMTAAYYLARLGHEVTVFEKDPEPGGTLRTGIPPFRLPRQVIDAEIEDVQRAGVEIRTNATVRSADDLFDEGYDAVLVASGAGKGRKMGIPGEDDPRVMDCLGFLRKANAGQPVRVGTRVAVVGGGSSAMDAARTARRLGADQVSVLYRRARSDMPASTEEIQEAEQEGVCIETMAAPTAIAPADGALTVTCIRMEPGPVDSSGRRRPMPIEGSEFEVELDALIMAIGQEAEPLDDLQEEFDRGGRLRVQAATLQTSRPGLFAAGDLVSGPASVIEAIAGGRQAAVSIDRYLGGEGEIDETLAPTEDVEGLELPQEQEEHPHVPMPRRPAAERLRDFGDVELGYTEEQALEEALRCLRCDLEELEEL